MFTILTMILFLVIFGKLFGLALRVGWGVFKFSMFLIFLPVIILSLIFGGMVFIAFPIILIAGIAGAAVGA